nr:hypothetical protein [Ferrimicrobium acidiphilum]
MSGILYVGVDLHEEESQLAVFEQDGSLVEERRVPTGELASFLSSLPGEKCVAMESVGFVYPIYDRLSSLQGCSVTVAYNGSWPLLTKYHPYKFGTKDDVGLLIPKNPLKEGIHSSLRRGSSTSRIRRKDTTRSQRRSLMPIENA